MRKVDFITLNRSDYSTIRPVILAALSDRTLETRVVVGGSHLLKRFGNTVEQILEDGIPVYKKVDFINDDDNSDSDIATSFARAVDEFVQYFLMNDTEYIFIIGDRWEMLAVASAANLCQIPIIHHSGGDITQGSRDNQIRYAISNLAHLHLVALEQHKERLRLIGEESWRLVVSGEPALSELNKYKTKDIDISDFFKMQSPDFVLATFHPTSYDSLKYEDQIDFFIAVLEKIEVAILLTAPNADPGNKVFFDKLAKYAEANQNVYMVSNLGAEKYYAAMAQALYMIGNSSSGMWEAPSFRLPVINIGNRQEGRLGGENVINVGMNMDEVTKAMKTVLSDEFKSIIKNCSNPYEKEDCIEIIMKVIKSEIDKDTILRKRLNDPLKIETNRIEAV